ncbi:MAG: four helix bundle protein [Patescibacteria group bacterium]|jgi:four helix bundle protein
MKDNPVQQKSYSFALRIINLYKFLVTKKKEFVLSKQILRCGTSIGANVEEAIGGQSRSDFIAKISIAYKEARETHYWLRLLHDSKFLTEKQFNSLINDCEALIKIIGKIQKNH